MRSSDCLAALIAACLIAGCHQGESTTTTAEKSAAPTADSASAASPGSVSHPDSTAGTTTSSTPTASPDQPPPLRDAYHTAPLDTVNAKVYAGWKYYNLNCARCHGEDVLGTTIAPHLIMSLKPNGPIPDEGTFLATVCGGREAKGMPAWCKIGLSTAQIDTIYSYVRGRSDAKLHPGRPALR